MNWLLSGWRRTMLNYKVKLELEWDGNFDEEDWIEVWLK